MFVTLCVFICKIAPKQVFMAFGRALPNQCFVGKNVTFRKSVFYNIW